MTSIHKKDTLILGISAYYHDSAAALLVNGVCVGAVQEERFTRKKHDSNFPHNAIKYLLDYQGIAMDDIECVAFYEKPFLKFERLLETYHIFSPRGLSSYLKAIPAWIKDKLFLKKTILKELNAYSIGTSIPKILFPNHHLSHSASTFYPSPFDSAAILTIDGVGEWATTTIGFGKGNEITLLRELVFPHSIGLLYSAFTGYCGFKVNSGEYKLMGLAPYGDHGSERVLRYERLILNEMIDVKEDGSILMNMAYFEYPTGLVMYCATKWEALLGIGPRQPEAELTQDYMDLAAAIQNVTEQIVLKLAQAAQKLTGSENLVMAGGVALNCVANGKIVQSKIFKNIWIQPASGDAGGALGAALAGWHIWKDMPRTVDTSLFNPYLGPEIGNLEIEGVIRKYKARYEHYTEFTRLSDEVSKVLSQGHVVGWVQGRMEWGPRSLGNRSILGDARNSEMQKKLNLKIKFREGFRPFAPAVIAEECAHYFELSEKSPYMLLVAPVATKLRFPEPENYRKFSMRDRLYHQRSSLPSITHVDYSARVQTIHQEISPRFYTLLQSFKKLTECSVLVNTSFNVRGEPIVCTAEDAYRCFMRTEMDYLVIGDYVFEKKAQSQWKETSHEWKKEFVLD